MNNKLLTVHTAEPSDIWPSGSGYSREDEDAIIKIARTEVTPDDVASCDQVFAVWFKFYFLAEGRFRQRQQQAVEKQVTEGENARRIARLEKRLAVTSKNVSLIYDELLSPTKGDPTGDILLFRLIRNIAWQQVVDRKVMRDTGVWRSEKLYGPGAAVTHDGQLWCCQQEVKGVEPGDGVCWRLTHKSDLVEVRSMVRNMVRAELDKHKGTSK